MVLEALPRIGVPYVSSKLVSNYGQKKADLSWTALHDWLTQIRVRTTNGGGSAKALNYTLKRWPNLIRYAPSGHLPIDNNPVEDTIRPNSRIDELLPLIPDFNDSLKRKK